MAEVAKESAAMGASENSSTLEHTFRLVVHIVAGFIGAAVLFGVAILSHLAAEAVESRQLLSPILASILYVFEYVLFALDAICFGYLTIMETWRFIREISRGK